MVFVETRRREAWGIAMKIRIAAAAGCAAIFIAAAGFAIAQGAWPQIAKADLQSCRDVIIKAHDLEIAELSKKVTTYCVQTSADYRADICKVYRDQRDRSGDEEDLAWYVKGNARCESGEYPCFGGAVINDTRTGRESMMKMVEGDSIITAAMDFWDASHKADNCAARVWLQKYNASVGSGTTPTPPVQPVQPVKPVAGAIKANDPTFQSNIKTFGADQLLALVNELLATGNIDVAKLARNALLQRFPDSPLVPVVSQLITSATTNGIAAATPTPAPATSQTASDRVRLDTDAAAIAAFAKIGETLTVIPGKTYMLSADTQYAFYISDCSDGKCIAFQLKSSYPLTPQTTFARVNSWNTGKLYGRGSWTATDFSFDMVIRIPVAGIGIPELADAVRLYRDANYAFYQEMMKP